MIYSYQSKNKFCHLLLDDDVQTWASNGGIGKYLNERRAWLKENFGQFNDRWTQTTGTLCGNEKFYWSDLSSETHDHQIKSATQWGFKTEEDALAFKLAWT